MTTYVINSPADSFVRACGISSELQTSLTKSVGTFFAYEGFCVTVARLFQRQLCFSASSHMGFYVVAYGFQSVWCPKGHYLGRCTGLLRYQLIGLFRPVCPSLFYRSDWLADPIASASFPCLTLPLFVDSLDSKL
jgi:hypothetical protein